MGARGTSTPNRRAPLADTPAGASVRSARRSIAQLTRFALEREDALLDEHVVPLFMAPPDVCVEAKKTLFYGLVPTSSAEIADVPVDPAQALGNDFGPGSAAFTRAPGRPAARRSR